MQPRSGGSAWAVLFSDADRSWTHADAAGECRRGACGGPADRGSSRIPQRAGELLASVRTGSGRGAGGSAECAGRKRGLQAQIATEVAAEITRLIGEEPALAQLEVSLRRQALAAAARALERYLNADTSDYVGSVTPCRCGEQARYVGRRTKSVVSVLGTLVLQRAYYHCTRCGEGFFPRDRHLGIERSSLSPGVTRMVGLVGAATSFEEGSTLMRELAGVDVCTKRVERTAKRLGAELAVVERQDVAPELDRPVPPTLYVGVDGTGVPMRAAEVAGRCGKQPDGSARTREVKLCVVWSAEGRDAEGRAVRDPGSLTHTAAIESAATRDTDDTVSDFAKRALRESARRRFEKARRRVVLGDGAPWIWNLAGEQFPGAIEIVDMFHAKQHLAQLSATLWGANNEICPFWLPRRYAELEAGDIESLVTRLEVHAHHSEEARKAVLYFSQNRQRMRYRAFRQAGLCTSTGVVEAACKNTIGTRLKRPGMHWSTAGANAITALRCAVLSNRFDRALLIPQPANRAAA